MKKSLHILTSLSLAGLIVGTGLQTASAATTNNTTLEASASETITNLNTQLNQQLPDQKQLNQSVDQEIQNQVQRDKDVAAALKALEDNKEQPVYNGECYGMTAWYVDHLKGPTLMGSGHEFAQDIGQDYDWAAAGWTVTEYPKISDIKPGDVICWQAGGKLSPGIYGHTGVVKSIDAQGNMVTYEQNSEAGRIIHEYNRTFNDTKIKSVIHKN